MSFARRKSIAALFGLLILVIVGCSNGNGERPTVPPNSTPTPRPTEVPAPTSTPTATSTPAPTPTPTQIPTPTVTPTPGVPNAAFLAQLNLSEHLNIGPNIISIQSYAEATWPDTSYGCPLPGTVYAQVQVRGWNVLFSARGETYEYHTDESGDVLVNCTANREIERNTINIVSRANLRSTTLIEMRRRGATGTFNLKSTVSDSAAIKAIVDVLDVPMLLGPAATCTEVFRLVFITASGNQTIGAICGGNSRLIRGDQAFWAGRDAQAPKEFSSLIGPYFSDEPLPTLPS